MVMDHYGQKWDRYMEPLEPQVPQPEVTITFPPIDIDKLTKEITDKILADLPDFEELVRKAKEYDKLNNQPDCELDSKKQKVKKLADKLGVKIDFL